MRSVEEAYKYKVAIASEEHFFPAPLEIWFLIFIKSYTAFLLPLSWWCCWFGKKCLRPTPSFDFYESS
jgi:hypothetical protein